jgi:hypothetical protein
MKKIIVFILAFIYMGVTSGIAMDIHYCMGKKAGFDFYKSTNDKCGKCGMKGKKGCCKDDHKFYKLSDSHKNVSNDLKFEIFSNPVITVFVLYDWNIYPSFCCKQIQNNSPPVISSPSLCVMNCIFRL